MDFGPLAAAWTGAPSRVAAWMLSLAAAATVSALKPNSWNKMVAAALAP